LETFEKKQKWYHEKCNNQGRTQGGVEVKTPPSAWYFTKTLLLRECRAWFFTKIRGLRAEEYVYYVNKLRQNMNMTSIVTSQTAHTKRKW